MSEPTDDAVQPPAASPPAGRGVATEGAVRGTGAVAARLLIPEQ